MCDTRVTFVDVHMEPGAQYQMSASSIPPCLEDTNKHSLAQSFPWGLDLNSDSSLARCTPYHRASFPASDLDSLEWDRSFSPYFDNLSVDGPIQSMNPSFSSQSPAVHSAQGLWTQRIPRFSLILAPGVAEDAYSWVTCYQRSRERWWLTGHHVISDAEQMWLVPS